MGIALFVLGLFLWFALAFNGGAGEPLVNYSFFASALFMVAAGLMKSANFKWSWTRITCTAALISYLPMVWQRFNFEFGPDWRGLYYDIGIVIFMAFFIASKPNKGHQEDAAEPRA